LNEPLRVDCGSHECTLLRPRSKIQIRRHGPLFFPAPRSGGPRPVSAENPGFRGGECQCRGWPQPCRREKAQQHQQDRLGRPPPITSPAPPPSLYTSNGTPLLLLLQMSPKGAPRRAPRRLQRGGGVIVVVVDIDKSASGSRRRTLSVARTNRCCPRFLLTTTVLLVSCGSVVVNHPRRMLGSLSFSAEEEVQRSSRPPRKHDRITGSHSGTRAVIIGASCRCRRFRHVQRECESTARCHRTG
jgi:hypothetical protein